MLGPVSITTQSTDQQIVARIADALQAVESDLKKVGREVFSLNAHRANAAVEKDLGDVVKTLGRRSALVANLRESLLSVSRMLQFFLNNAATWMRGDLAVQFRSVMRDVKSLDDYTNQQTQEMTFLLESTLGLINIQQNQIRLVLQLCKFYRLTAICCNLNFIVSFQPGD